MEWPKLKNIIILILLLANLFLLVMVGVQERGSAQYQEQAIADAISVLERGGIRIDPADVPKKMKLTAMTAERDRQSEADLASALIGVCDCVDLGGGRYSYEGAFGQAEFRGNGNFNVTFYDGAQRAEASGEESAHAVALMEEVGFSGNIVSQEKTGETVVLVLRQTWQGLAVHSCQITLTYENGCLLSIAGQRLMGAPQSGGEKSDPITVPTALLRVLNGINDLGDICSEITAMEPGYLLTTSGDATRLIPIWYVTTDTGAYRLNALTGALERA